MPNRPPRGPDADSDPVAAFPPLFGVRRPLACPAPQRQLLTAGDGATLQMHHIAGAGRGPVILAAGTAMSALSFLTDTTEQSFAEYLWSQGFDVWLFDWRTSPYLEAHERGYTLEDVARYDWPAALAHVRGRTGAEQVGVLAHCLSSPCLLLSLLRGHADPAQVRSLVASQVGVHLVMNRAHRAKLRTYTDRLLPGGRMVHQAEGTPREGSWDLAVGLVGALWPRSYSCDNPACHRQSASYGDIVHHERINEETHRLMGPLVPEVSSDFLKDVGPNSRRDDVLTEADRASLHRLDLPLLLISGAENQMFVPDATARTYALLHDALGDTVQRRVFDGFGHLDCYLSGDARDSVWPVLADFLAGPGQG